MAAHRMRTATPRARATLRVLLCAVAVTVVVGASMAYAYRLTLQPASSRDAVDAPPGPNLPLPGFALPVPAPVPSPTAVAPTATATPTPRPPAPPHRTTRPRSGAEKPRPRPTTPSPRPPVYLAGEAESPVHDVGGYTRPRDNDAASGDTVVGWVGSKPDNTLRLSVTVPDADRYAVTLFYISADTRRAVIRVNGGPGVAVDFPPTGDWSTVCALTLRLALHGGRNTIELGNPYDYAPDFDRFTITR